MYEIERTNLEITVKGPDSYIKVFKADSIGIVLRASLILPFEDLAPYAVRYDNMTDAEIVAQALEIESYPM